MINYGKSDAADATTPWSVLSKIADIAYFGPSSTRLIHSNLQIYLPNPPSQCEMIISIGGYQDLFTVRSQESGITDINPDDLLKLRASYNRSSVCI